jgi:hypothetical protein
MFKTCLVIIALSACTPGMHRAYQVTMVGLGGASAVHSGLQTYAALQGDPSVQENDPLLSTNPGALRVAGAVSFNLAVGTGVLLLPRGERAWNGQSMPDWTLDVLATTYAAFGMFLAYNDTAMTNVRWYNRR